MTQNEWKEKVVEYKEYVETVKAFIGTDEFLDLPDGVRIAIRRGLRSFEEKLPDYEKWAKQDI